MKKLLLSSVTLTSLYLVVLASRQYRAWHAGHAALEQAIEDTQLKERVPAAATRAVRERDLHWGRMALARGVLFVSLDLSHLFDLSEEEARRENERVVSQLKMARDLAVKALSERPATWQALMILGGSVLVEWLRTGDPRLVSERDAWEVPLRASMDLAPGKDEPQRLLAAGSIGIWPNLTFQERREAKGWIKGAFQDPSTYRQLVPVWLLLVPNREEALSVIPERAFAWSTLQSIYARRSDWAGVVDARRRWDLAHLAELQADLASAEERLRGGDLRRARGLFLSVAARVRPDRRYAGILSTSLEDCPPGPSIGRYEEPLAKQLDWVLGRAMLGDGMLSQEAVSRLAASGGELEPPQKAMAEVLKGNLGAAEMLERRSEALNTEPWAPYWLLKARHLLDHGSPGEARAALLQVHRAWRRAVYAELDAKLGRETVQPSRREWQSTDWRIDGRTVRLELRTPEDSRHIEVVFDRLPERGVPAEVRWDAQAVDVAILRAGEPLIVDVGSDGGLHVLEVEPLVGGRLAPQGARAVP